MAMHTAGLLAMAGLAAAGLWTASDPFVGKWKLDISRSVIVDQMVVEAAGPNRYTFRFEGAPAETIIADGTDQPGLDGTTLSVKPDESGALRVVRKQASQVVVSATWRLSDHDQILHDAFAARQPGGSTATVNYQYRRMSGNSGFAGTWESTTKPTGLVFELQIQPHGGKGLSFASPGSVKSITFDGREHAVGAANKDVTASGERPSERRMAYTEEVGGRALDTRTLALSGDGKTLTINVHKAGQATPEVLVFERE